MANTSQLYHPTYAAFCRRKGDFKNRNWNTELLEGMQNVLERPLLGLKAWISVQRFYLERDVSTAFKKNTKLLNGIVYKIHLLGSVPLTSYKDNVQLAPIALENFMDNMDDREACIMDSINKLFERLTQKLR